MHLLCLLQHPEGNLMQYFQNLVHQNFLAYIETWLNQEVMTPQVLGNCTFPTVSWQTEVLKEQKLEYMGLWRQVGDWQGWCLVKWQLLHFSSSTHISMWPVQFWFLYLCLNEGVTMNCSAALTDVSCLVHVTLPSSWLCAKSAEMYWNLLFKPLNTGITTTRKFIMRTIFTGEKSCSVQWKLGFWNYLD